MGHKQDLQKIIQDLETKKFREGEAKGLVSEIQSEQTKALTPVFQHLAEEMVGSMAANFEKAIKAIKVEVPEMKQQAVDVRLPEMKFADFPAWPDFPEIKVPEIKIPEIKIPDFKVTMPDQMEVFGDINLKGITKKNPLPVQLMGPDGKPFEINIPVGGSGGGRGDFFTILGIINTVGVVSINPDGTPATSVSGSSGGSTQAIDSSGNVYSQSNPMPVTVVSGSAATTGSALVDSSGVQYSGSNPLSVTVVAGAATSTKAQIGNSDGDFTSANPLPVVFSSTASTAASIVDSSGVQYSGSNPIPVTLISGTISSTKAQIGNSDGDFSVANPLPITGPVVVTSVTNTIAALNVDSSGVGYSGSNPIPVTLISGTISSTKAQIGNSDGDFSVANPLPITGPVVVTSITNTIAALNVDSSGVGYSGSNPVPVTLISGTISSTKAQIGNSDGDFTVANPLPITGPVVVTSVTNTIAAAVVDSSGVEYSGSNPVPVTIVSGAGSSTVAQIGNSDGGYSVANPLPITGPVVVTSITNTIAVSGDIAHDAVDDGAYPIKIGGVANSGSPTAVSAGDRVEQWHSVHGALVVAPFTSQTSSFSDGTGFIIPATNASNGSVTPGHGPMFSFNGTNWDRIRNTAGEGNALRVQMANDAVASVVVNSGTITTVTSITNSVAAALVDSSGVAYSGSNPLPTTASLSTAQGQGDAATAMRVVVAGNSDASVVVNSGTITAVTNITNSVAAALVDSSGIAYSGSNPLPTTATLSTPQGQGDSATAMRVVVAGNSDASVVVNSGTITAVTSITNSVAASLVDSSGVQYSGSNPLPTTATLSTPSGQGDAATAMRVVVAGNSDASVVVNSGTITAVTNITNSVAAALVDSTGIAYSGSNPLPTTAVLSLPSGQGDAATATRVVIAGNSDASVVVNSGTITAVTTITNSVSAALVDSSNVQYSGSNPVPVTLISGSISSTRAQIGNTDGDYSNANPLPIVVTGGAAATTAAVLTRQTNPTAVAADYVPFGADDLGRQLTRPIQVRDLIKTAYVTLSTGTEATLLAGVAGSFLDLIYILAANTSSAAQQLDIRAVTGGNVIASLYIPATSTIGFTLPVPFPQDATGNNWTVDMADVTNSNILISALFSQEI